MSQTVLGIGLGVALLCGAAWIWALVRASDAADRRRREWRPPAPSPQRNPGTVGSFVAHAAVRSELTRARARFGPFASAHEGLAVIREEYLEFERAVFHGDGAEALTEAVQLAAMATRYIVDIGSAGRNAERDADETQAALRREDLSPAGETGS